MSTGTAASISSEQLDTLRTKSLAGKVHCLRSDDHSSGGGVLSLFEISRWLRDSHKHRGIYNRYNLAIKFLTGRRKC